MSRPPADRIVGLYREKADGWIADRGRDLSAGPDGPDEALWLDRFTVGWRSGARVLDVGCGSGWPIAAALIRRGFHVTGVDASAGLIAHAARTLPQGDWRVGDMRALDVPGVFNGVLAWHSLFHLTPEDQADALPALASRVATGGRLMFTSGPHHGEAIGDWRGEPLYHGSLAPDAYVALLKAAGLTVDFPGAPAPHQAWLAHRSG